MVSSSPGSGGMGSSASSRGGTSSGGVMGSPSPVVNLDRITVEIRVGEVIGRTPKIHQGEVGICVCRRVRGCRARVSA